MLQPTYDTRYGFSNQQDIQTNNTLSNQDLPSAIEQQNVYSKSGLYSSQQQQQQQQNVAHKRQASSLHGHFNHTKGLGIPEIGQKEGLYGQAPDLPPRIDRAVKPMGLLTTANKIPNGRSAHERLFGTKPPDSTESSSDVVPQFSGKLGSLDRSQNSKSVSKSTY